MSGFETMRLLLIGTPGSEFRLAAAMARDAGAQVAMADTPADAVAWLRTNAAGLVMIDVETDVAGFMRQLRGERFAVPVLACGIDAPAARAVAAIHAGARDYVPLPPERDLIAAALATAARAPAATLVGGDPALLAALAFARAIAPSGGPVLIVGEGGTGRETLARTIHAASNRTGPFLDIDCAAMAPSFVEAELFGHEPGAYPGATARRIGRFEQAAGGTMFVAAIDRLPAAAQARLVALLGSGDVRLVAATGIDLAAAAADGTFRADLHFALTNAVIQLPPLRDRLDDLPALARHFAERADGAPVRTIDPAALALLAAHGWPGNVGELEDVVRRAALLARGPAILPADIVLADGTRIAPPVPGNEAEVTGLVGHTVEDVERALILRTLERCRGNRTSASGILGISVRTMRNKLKIFVEAGIPVAPAL